MVESNAAYENVFQISGRSKSSTVNSKAQYIHGPSIAQEGKTQCNSSICRLPPTIAAAAAAASASATSTLFQNPSFNSLNKRKLSLYSLSFLKSPNTQFSKLLRVGKPCFPYLHASKALIARAGSGETPATSFHGTCYVVRDNVDTDQIIPAEYLTLVPSNPEEYKKLGSYALIGLPDAYTTRFIEPGESSSKFKIIIAGYNFGCGSSREHAPVALGAAGVTAVVAESYARIFFRNSVATGEVYPLESEGRICDECSTGDVVTVELGESKLINHTTGKEYVLKPIGDAGPVIEAGGIFAYARKTGMIPTASA